MGRIEKTVFISYRRTNYWTALAVYQNLTAQGFDVFIDYQNIRSGNFEQVILDNIKARAHFLVVLSPSALERCSEPSDLMRREIETAIDEERNIVPLMMEGFDFGSPTIMKILTGKFALLNHKNGLRIIPDFFIEAMERLRKEYLNVAVEDVHLHPLSIKTEGITEAQKVSANEAAPVETIQLSAEEWFERGNIFSESNNIDEAIRCYTNAISLKPDFAEAYVSRGAEYGEKGDLDTAISDFHEGVRLQPDNARAYNNLGVGISSKGDHLGAIKNLTEAIRLEPDYASALSNRGSLHIDLKNYTEGIKDCTDAIRIDPNLPEAYNNRGVAFDQIGNIGQAIKDFTKAIRLKPDFADAYRNRGTTYDEKGNTKSAIRDYTKAIRLKPDFANAFYDRGIVHCKVGSLDDAIRAFTQAILIKPDFADAYKNRGIVFEARKDNISAIADFQSYLAAGGKDKSVNLRIKNLKKCMRTNKRTRRL